MDREQREQILQQLRELGCSDHGCLIRPPGGMGTNGGCHCLTDIQDPDTRVHIRRVLMLLRQLAGLQPVTVQATSTGVLHPSHKTGI